MAKSSNILSNLPRHVREAVRFYWETRGKQAGSGAKDQGLRSAVTVGAQMDGFIELLAKLVIEAGIDRSHIHYRDSLELPGYFRPTNRWDFLVVLKGQLVAAIRVSSEAEGSIVNNFGKHTGETLVNALDLWATYRSRAFGTNPGPCLGHLLLLEDCPESKTPIRVEEPHFKAAEEFNSSYAQRYELFCRRLFLDRHYHSSALLLSSPAAGHKAEYSEPAADLSFENLAWRLAAHVALSSTRPNALRDFLRQKTRASG